MFEVSMVMMLMVSIILLAISKTIKKLPIFFMSLSIILFLSSGTLLFPFAAKTLSYPAPALRSPLLSIHVLSAVSGEIFLFLTLCLYLTSNKILIKGNVSAKKIYNAFANFGYFLFTFGALIVGPIWAKLSWSSYWSWDPKEAWSLLVWIFFTAFILLNSFYEKHSKIALFFLMLAFGAFLATFAVIPVLSTSLHNH